MKLIIYSEDDKFAKLVATTLYGLRTRQCTGRFGDLRHVAHERVWTGAIAVADKTGAVAEYPLQLAAVSVGPDYKALLQSCGVDWSQTVRLQTWKPNLGASRPKRLMRFVQGSPLTIWLRDLDAFWSPAQAERWQNKMKADARRVALQIIDAMLVHREAWLASRPKKTAPTVPPVRSRRRRSLFPYFSEL